ncbi:hypothetical protein ANCCAN_20963 [Ancylostoma caninum]|uniref:PDZ domain-containing protein n=1 Tax=Ancylostoma caninum TaxID=29170 RepID=A0A368FM43_ANCCA|nr:hypothetical protein ANCCAN_20963 [Ancylostoma caninum]
MFPQVAIKMFRQHHLTYQTAETSTEGMIERCVVVQRQSDGYGFTVTGDHPVFVHTVKPEGAAFCAGVREGDRILKVFWKLSLHTKYYMTI